MRIKDTFYSVRQRWHAKRHVFIRSDESRWKSHLKIVVGLQISTWEPKADYHVHDHCSLAIRRKKCLWIWILWRNERRDSRYKVSLVSVCRLFRRLACVENSICYPSFLSLIPPFFLHSAALSLCPGCMLVSVFARKKTSDRDIISRKINYIRCCGFHFARLKSKIPTRIAIACPVSNEPRKIEKTSCIYKYLAARCK